VFTFSRRTTSLRVGGLAAGRSCLPGLRRGGGRQAGVTVLSSLVWLCELTAGQVRSASSGGRTAPLDTLRCRPDMERTCLAVRLNSHRHTGHDETVLSVSCLAWRCELALTGRGPEEGSCPDIAGDGAQNSITRIFYD